MGKRSDFARVERDFYPTPRTAVLPLIPHLNTTRPFIEPCAGDGRLVNWLIEFGVKCASASDIEPLAKGVKRSNIFDIRSAGGAQIITNPPWGRKILHPLIEHCLSLTDETWLLFDADWPHTKQSAHLMRFCRDIVPIGRVKWIEGSKHTGKDNCCWYRFSPSASQTIFHERIN